MWYLTLSIKCHMVNPGIANFALPIKFDNVEWKRKLTFGEKWFTLLLVTCSYQRSWEFQALFKPRKHKLLKSNCGLLHKLMIFLIFVWKWKGKKNINNISILWPSFAYKIKLYVAAYGSKLIATNEPQQLTSPGYPNTFVESNLVSTWFLNVPNGYFIQLVLNHLGNETCCIYLEVWYGIWYEYGMNR